MTETDEAIQYLITQARAAKQSGQLPNELATFFDFDPVIIPDDDYPALAFEWSGDPGNNPAHLTMVEDSFDVACTLFTADVEPGVASRQLRRLGRAVKTWLAELPRGIRLNGKAARLKLGRAQTGFRRAGSNYSAACTFTVTFTTRG